MPDIVLRSVWKVFPGGNVAVRGVDLTIEQGTLVTLVGPSGCGKTTLLRMIAGLEDVDGGEVIIGGKVVNDVEPRDRDIAMVFQSYALYPHMSVFDNLAFGLRRQRLSRREIAGRIEDAAEILGIGELLRRKPRQLSGGQRQRVAMGRAIVRKPQVFLLDEPLSNLDAQLRVEVRSEIARLQRDLGVTMIFVTHDQTEAMTLGDIAVVMREGLIEQAASPSDLYNDPTSAFVAGFIGSPPMNLLLARVADNASLLEINVAGSTIAVPIRALPVRERAELGERKDVCVGVRCEHIDVAQNASERLNRIALPVELVEEFGFEKFVHFALRDRSSGRGALDRKPGGLASPSLIARVDGGCRATVGDDLSISLDPAHFQLFDVASGRRLAGEGRVGLPSELVAP